MAATMLFVLQTLTCEHLSQHQHYITIMMCLSVYPSVCMSLSVHSLQLLWWFLIKSIDCQLQKRCSHVEIHKTNGIIAALLANLLVFITAYFYVRATSLLAASIL